MNIVDFDNLGNCVLATTNSVFLVDPLETKNILKAEVCNKEHTITAVKFICSSSYHRSEMSERVWAAASTQSNQVISVWQGVVQMRRILLDDLINKTQIFNLEFLQQPNMLVCTDN